jgi:hypothetical protein
MRYLPDLPPFYFEKLSGIYKSKKTIGKKAVVPTGQPSLGVKGVQPKPARF